MKAAANNISQIIVDPPAPHSKKQALIMQAFLMPNLRDIFIACGTKYGKTQAASTALITAGIDRPGTKWRWVAPIYEQAKVGMEDYFPKILPPAPHVDFKPGNMLIAVPQIGTTFEFWHAKNPMSLEGKAVHGYVIDEAAKCPEQTYFSARTTTTVTKGSIMAISTPLGKNWFYQHAMNCRDAMDWAINHGKVPDKLFLTAPTTENPFVPKESIEYARQSMPERLFRQYYLAEFLDEGSVFVGTRDCFYHADLDSLRPGPRQRWLHHNAKEMRVVIGVDWAKSVDYTVFIAIEVETRRVVGFERFHRVPYTEAIRRLVLFSREFHDIDIINHDRTGVGSAIDDQLQYTSLPCKGVLFTNNSKSEMVTQLITSVEQQRIRFPRWPELISEFDAYESNLSPSGLITYSAPAGKHDDIVSATMLAHAALLKYGDRTYDVRFLDDLASLADPKAAKPPKDSIESFYAALTDDDDDQDDHED